MLFPIRQIILAFLLFGAVYSTQCTEIEVKDRKLFRIVPETSQELEFLKNCQLTDPSVIFWNGIGGIGEPVDILASPDAIKDVFHDASSSLRKSIQTKFADVEIELENDDSKFTPITSPDTGSTLSPQLIPGTTLSTMTYYKIELKRFQDSFLKINGIQEGSTGQKNYVIVQKHLANNTQYQAGGQKYDEIQFYFSPSDIDGWYTLRNRHMDANHIRAFGTWNRRPSRVNDQTYNYVVMQTFNQEDNLDKYLWKPVSTSEPGKYRIEVKSSIGFLTWTYEELPPDSYFIQVEDRKDLKTRTNYEEGNKWWDDTLFTFYPVEAELEAQILQIDLDSRGIIQDGLMPLLMKTNCDGEFEGQNLTFSNRGSASEVQKIKYKSNVEGKMTLNLSGDYNGFSKVVFDSAKMVVPWSSKYFEVFGVSNSNEVSGLELKTKESIQFSTSVLIPPWEKLTVQICHQHLELSESDDNIPVRVIVEVACKSKRPVEDSNLSNAHAYAMKEAVDCVETKSKNLNHLGKLLGRRKTSLVYSISGTISKGVFGYQGIAVPVPALKIN